MRTLYRGIVAVGLVAASFMMVSADTVKAADYPSKPVTVVIPFPAGGGGTGRWVRIMASVAFDEWGVDWRVRNVPGASAVAGWKWLLERPADGYTVMQSSPTPVIALAREKNPVIDPAKDIKVCASVSQFRPTLIVKNDAPYKTFQEFVDYAKANPGKITHGASGSNTLGAVAVLNQLGVQLNYVVYDGSSEALNDFLGGHVDVASAPGATMLNYAPERGRVLATFSNREHPEGFEKSAGNEVPTATDLDVDGFSGLRWIGVHPDTPNEICKKISDLFGKTVANGDAKHLLGKVKETVIFSPMEQAQTEYANMVKAVKTAAKLIDQQK